MELRELNTFVHIAKAKSFSKAAHYLGYSQAAVTIQIKQLEAELDTMLFDRIGKQISLTHEGELFYTHAVRILRDVKEAQDAVSGENELTGSLCIGAIESISSAILPQLLLRFHSQYPNVCVKVIIDTPAVLFQMMNSNAIDLVYTLDQKIFDAKWEKELEEPERILFSTASSSPLAAHPDVTLEELLDQPFLLTEKNASYRFILDQYLAAQGLEVHPFLESGSTGFLLKVLRETSPAVSFLPEFTIQQDVEAGTLTILNVKDLNLRIWRQIFHHKDKHLTKEILAFIALAKSSTDTGEAADLLSRSPDQENPSQYLAGPRCTIPKVSVHPLRDGN